jgi:glycerol kinase
MEGINLMKKYILAIDQGTSGTKAILFDNTGCLVGRHNEKSQQFYPRPGWVEQDAEEIFTNVILAIRSLLKRTAVETNDIVSIAISNQRETVLVWEKSTGKPVCNALVWNCGRAEEICIELKNNGFETEITEKTGLVLSPYFSAAKIKWIFDNVDGVREKAMRGELLFGTIDTWLIYKLTGGKIHATDYSNASRTQLFNIKTLSWDEELMQIFSIPSSMAPKVLSSNAVFGTTDVMGILKAPIPITGVMGDSHAALFGQCCFKIGMAKATYGTGSSIMMNIGNDYIQSKKGLVTSIAWGINGKIEYVFEGNINFSGAVIKWLIDDLELISSEQECSQIAQSVTDSGGVYLVPSFTGFSAPYWDSKARAIITGMTRGTKKAHIIRAAEESIAYQIRDITDLMKEEASVSLSELRVDGGPTRDDFLMQFQSDILSTNVIRNNIEELSAAGAAYMSGLTMGFWESKETLESLRTTDKNFNPKMDNRARGVLYDGWKSAVNRALSHEKD